MAIICALELVKSDGERMAPIDYIRIDADVLRLEVSDKAKMLLGMIKSFNCNGLTMSNPELAKLLNCSCGSIKRALREIEQYIRIENAQSRYRKIFYWRKNEPVETTTGADMNQYNDSTGASHTPTGSNTTPTGADMNHITKERKNINISFVPPTFEECKEYAESIGFVNFDPQRFIDHYSAVGWKSGKTKIVDWKAKVRIWHKNHQNKHPMVKIERGPDGLTPYERAKMESTQR
jgi:hypothetical protein